MSARSDGRRRPDRLGSLLARLMRSLRGLVGRDHYEPSRHYMRGPGPKTLGKRSAGEPSET